MPNFGVHSEVGRLRTVMVCRPGLAHQRLTPGNCRDLATGEMIIRLPAADVPLHHYAVTPLCLNALIPYIICNLQKQKNR